MIDRFPCLHSAHSTDPRLPASQEHFYHTLTRAFNLVDTVTHIFGSSSQFYFSAFLSLYRTQFKGYRLDLTGRIFSIPFLISPLQRILFEPFIFFISPSLSKRAAPFHL